MIKTNQTVFLKLGAFNQKYSKNYSDYYVNYAYLNEHIYILNIYHEVNSCYIFP